MYSPYVNEMKAEGKGGQMSQQRKPVDWAAHFWANKYQPKHGSVRADIRHAEEAAKNRNEAKKQ